MKWSFGVMLSLSLAVALAFGIYLTHRDGDPPPAATMSVTVTQPTPGAETPVLHASSEEEGEVPILPMSSDEEARVSLAVAGSDRSTEMHHEEIASLRAEVASLRTEVSTLQRWTRAQQRAARVMAPERADYPTKELRSDPGARAAAERERQKQMEVVETNFRQEAADPRWSFEAERAVQTVLAGDEIVQNTVLGLECRSQTCRMELADDDTGELAQTLPLLLQQLGQTLPSATVNYVDDGNGGKVMALYLSRAANEPPRYGK